MSIATPEFVCCWHVFDGAKLEHVKEPCERCTAELTEPQECLACGEDDKRKLFMCAPFDPVNLCEKCAEAWAGGYGEGPAAGGSPHPF